MRSDEDLTAAKELAASDPDFASEIPALEIAAQNAAEKLEELLLPRDPNDDRDVILEVKAGAGGDESALFAGDLLRMYMRYAEKRNWKVEILDATESEMGGYKAAESTPPERMRPDAGAAMLYARPRRVIESRSTTTS